MQRNVSSKGCEAKTTESLRTLIALSGIPFHVFRLFDQRMVFDTNSEKVLSLHRWESDILQSIESLRDHHLKLKASLIERDPQAIASLASKVNDLQRKGILAYEYPRVLSHPRSPDLPRAIQRNLGQVVLQVTQRCNLRCKYCVYSGGYYNRSHAHVDMPRNILLHGIDYLMLHSLDTPNPVIGFYGGEPLLQLNEIMRGMEYIDQKYYNRKYKVGISTNGTLLSERTCRFLIKRDVTLYVSLDGPELVHDKNRVTASGAPTHALVEANLSRLSRISKAYCSTNLFINCVADEMADFRQVSNYFYKLKKSIGFASLNYTVVESSLKRPCAEPPVALQERRKQYIKDFDDGCFGYILHKRGMIPRDRVSELVFSQQEKAFIALQRIRDNRYVRSGPSYHPSGPCLPGSTKLFIAADGKMMPCERLNEMNSSLFIGNLSRGVDIKRALPLLNPGAMTPEQCLRCWAGPLCTSCIQKSDDGRRLTPEKRILTCSEVKGNAEWLLKVYAAYREMGVL